MVKFRTRIERKHLKKKLYLILGTVMLSMVFALTIFLSRDAESTEGESKKQTDEITVSVTEVHPETYDEAAKTEAETTNASKSATEETEKEDITHSEKLIEILLRAGYSVDSLSGTQLITVESEGTSAVVNSFEKVDGVWKECDVLPDEAGFVGYMGVSADASEYASYTPEGLFSLGTGFGIEADPGTKLDYFQVTEDSYWVDDVNSEYYNMHVEGKEDKDFESAEHLIDYSGSYDYCVFIEYNSNPVVPGKGSAFFLHVGAGATEGCVAISEEAMINTLCWLDKTCSPEILIF